MEEKTYPIWYISVEWEQDGKHDQKYPKWHEGLPEGRIFNSTGFHKMYQDTVSEEEVLKDANVWWSEYVLTEKIKAKNPSNQKIKVKFVWNETWCPAMFLHWTFDKGQTDAEVLQSFEQFVRRVETHNQNNKVWNELGWYDEPYCLMGAEERWRWRGEKEDDPAPCRCEHCKEQGLIRVNH